MSSEPSPVTVQPAKPGSTTSPIVEQEPTEGIVWECVWDGHTYSNGAVICVVAATGVGTKYRCVRGSWVQSGSCLP